MPSFKWIFLAWTRWRFKPFLQGIVDFTQGSELRFALGETVAHALHRAGISSPRARPGAPFKSISIVSTIACPPHRHEELKR